MDDLALLVVVFIAFILWYPPDELDAFRESRRENSMAG